MKRFKKVICMLTAALTLFSASSCAMQEKPTDQELIPTDLSVTKAQKRETLEGDIFVSPTGDDANDGSKARPVRTAERALELSRSMTKESKVISFAEGEYAVSSLRLTEEDNGTVFYGEDNVVFNGGVTLNTSDFKPYQDGIQVLDLKPYGVTKEQIGDIKAFGQYNTAEKYGEAGSLYCELFCGGERMTLARYPNKGEMLKTGEILDNGDSYETYTKDGTQRNPDWADMTNPRGGTFAVDPSLTERMKTWKNSSDVWLFGYFQYDWADSTTPLASYSDNSVTTEYASVYGFKEGADYYFFNIFEELDEEGEWYIDKENLLLFFLPPSDFTQKSLELSLDTNDLVTLENANDVTFDGITFCGTRAGAIKGSGKNITVKNCTVRNVGENAVELTGEQILIENNTVTATGKAGILLTGGDRETLRSSGNVVTNNLIYNWSQVYRTYQAAVALHGVGGVCSHNEIYDSPHEAITYSGNNHIIEYNVIHDVVKESSDAGAIYAGRSWSYYGNVIRYNCLYNIGTDDFKASGIYFDDALSGQEAYGNLLVNVKGYAFLLGGGRDLTVTDNIIVNAGTPFSYDDRAIAGIEDGGWFTHAKTPGEGLWATLEEVDIHSAAWQKAFPQLSAFSDDYAEPDNAAFVPNPANSTVSGNIVVGAKKDLGDIAKRVTKFSTVEDNRLYTYKNTPFTETGVYGIPIPDTDFTQLPTGQMGRTYTLQ